MRMLRAFKKGRKLLGAPEGRHAGVTRLFVCLWFINLIA